MKKVLILIPYYKPGYQSGGPQRTIENVCNAFHGKAKIYIVTQNYDLGDADKPYNIAIGKWHDLDGIKIMYLPHKQYSPNGLKKLFQKFDTVYSCGLFERNSISTLILNRLYHNNNKQVYIAPMGVFSPGAFNSKHKKKWAFIQIIKRLGLYKNIIWSFTSDAEYKDAVKTFGNKRYIQNHIIAEDLPTYVDFDKSKKCVENKKDSGTLKIIFLSRICPQKNLLYAIKVLKAVHIDKVIEFDIFGVIEDKQYWRECQKEMKNLPTNIVAKYMGAVKPDDVIETFRKYDIFLFPTKGENYGHVIYEALAAGCVPIISDQTPWKDIAEKNCGTVLSLNQSDEFSRSIEEYSNMVLKLFSRRKKSISYAKEKRIKALLNSSYNEVFD